MHSLLSPGPVPYANEERPQGLRSQGFCSDLFTGPTSVGVPLAKEASVNKKEAGGAEEKEMEGRKGKGALFR